MRRVDKTFLPFYRSMAFSIGGSNVSRDQKTAKPDLMDVVAARAAMLSCIGLQGEDYIAVDEALGRVLTSPVLATRDQPPFDASSMDGYAARAADTPGSLKVIGESAAGRG